MLSQEKQSPLHVVPLHLLLSQTLLALMVQASFLQASDQLAEPSATAVESVSLWPVSLHTNQVIGCTIQLTVP